MQITSFKPVFNMICGNTTKNLYVKMYFGCAVRIKTRFKGDCDLLSAQGEEEGHLCEN